jgi:hypothetical protein
MKRVKGHTTFIEIPAVNRLPALSYYQEVHVLFVDYQNKWFTYFYGPMAINGLSREYSPYCLMFEMQGILI